MVCSTAAESVTSQVNACACTAGRTDLGDQTVEGFGVARQREHRGAAGSNRDRRCPPDAAGGARDDDVLTDQGTVGVVASCTIGVEVFSPVTPQLRRV